MKPGIQESFENMSVFGFSVNVTKRFRQKQLSLVDWGFGILSHTAFCFRELQWFSQGVGSPLWAEEDLCSEVCSEPPR